MVGNTPNYGRFDIIRALIFIDKNVSRLRLKQLLGVGEGTVRSILDILKRKKLIISTQKGHSLAKSGQLLANKLKRSFELRSFSSKNIYASCKKAALLVKGAAKKGIGYMERDIAVKNGAEGAMLFIYSNSRLAMPQMKGVSFKELEKLFEYKKGDILIITFAETPRHAENSALAVGLSIRNPLSSSAYALR